jgi:bacterioferritin-associated ferredoxin
LASANLANNWDRDARGEMPRDQGSQGLLECGSQCRVSVRSLRRESLVVIVCSCNVISDQQVRAVTAEQAVRGTSEVYRCLGCSAACGRCARTIRGIMNEVRARTRIDAACCREGACRNGEHAEARDSAIALAPS